MPASLVQARSFKPRVLVVDNDADNRELYRDSFTLAGWIVTEAGDGREALVQALKDKPSIVLMELRLPLIDGVALCEILRRDHATAEVPILVVTSESRAAELARAQRAGADAVLIKPATPDVIVREMRRLLTAAGAGTALQTKELSAPGRRKALVKAHQRLSTTAPDEAPASLTCPLCSQLLHYQETYIGGVSARHPERWDYFECARCGRFQYRYRTRKLRQLS